MNFLSIYNNTGETVRGTLLYMRHTNDSVDECAMEKRRNSDHNYKRIFKKGSLQKKTRRQKKCFKNVGDQIHAIVKFRRLASINHIIHMTQ